MGIITRVVLRVFTKLFTVIVPRDERVWVVGSWFGKRYADNSRYFYDYLTDNQIKYNLKKIIWVTDEDEVIHFIKDSGREVYKKNSLKSCYYHLRASVFLYDQNVEDINYPFTYGGLRVNLWHGIPLKKIGYHYKKKNKISVARSFLLKITKPFRAKNKDYLLATSLFSGKLLSSAFGSKTLQGPYPRNEYLIGHVNSPLSEEEKKFLNKLEASNKKIIFYLPTFRDKCDLKFLGTESIEIQKRIISDLAGLGYVLLTKVHYAGANQLSQMYDENLINLPPKMDIYPFLKKTDILITDYSSVYFDFLLLDREIVFLAYDLEYYQNDDRGLILDYEEYTPGEKVYKTSSLIQAIKKIKNKDVDYSKQRLELKSKIFSNNSLSEFVHLLKSSI